MSEHIYRYTQPRKEYADLSMEYHRMKHGGPHCRSFVEAIRDALKALEEDEGKLPSMTTVLFQIEGELLEQFYSDDAMDFDNVIRRVMAAKRKELRCE